MGVGEEQAKGDNSMVFWMEDMFARGFCMAFTRIQDSTNFFQAGFWHGVHLFIFSSFHLFFLLLMNKGKNWFTERTHGYVTSSILVCIYDTVHSSSKGR